MKFQVSPMLVRQYATVIIVNLSVFTTGMSIAWSSPMLVKLSDTASTPLSRPVTENEGSWIVSLGYLISIATNVMGSFLIDHIGRKLSFLACALPKLSMSLLLIFSTDVWMVILARTLMTVSDCFLFCIVPVYSAEIAIKEHRGSLGAFLQLFSSLGVVVTLSVGPFVSYHTFSYIFVALIAATTVPLLFIPESPYFHFSKGKTDEALKTLSFIRSSEAEAKLELSEYEKSTEGLVKIDKIELLKDKTFVKALLLTFLLFGGSQLVGYNAVTFYLQTILISTKTKVMPEVASLVIGLIQVVASGSVAVFSAVLKRKQILMTSLLGIFIGMICLGSFFQVSTEGHITGFMHYLPILSLILVVFCYSAGMGSVIWPIGAELFEGPGRAFGTSTALAVCQFTIFMTSKYFPLMTSALGPSSTYWFFSVNCVIIAVLIWVFLPETKDKTFREIQSSLGKNFEDTKSNIC